MNEIFPETQRDWSNDAQTNPKRFTTSKLRFKPVCLSLLLRASLVLARRRRPAALSIATNKATNKIEATLRPSLAASGFRPRPSVHAGPACRLPPGQAPSRRVRGVCRPHNLTPRELLMIGDSGVDPAFAAAAGCDGLWFGPWHSSPSGEPTVAKTLDYLDARLRARST